MRRQCAQRAFNATAQGRHQNRIHKQNNRRRHPETEQRRQRTYQQHQRDQLSTPLAQALLEDLEILLDHHPFTAPWYHVMTLIERAYPIPILRVVLHHILHQKWDRAYRQRVRSPKPTSPIRSPIFACLRK